MLAKLTCQWCGKEFTHPQIYPEDIEKYGKGGGVICPHCWRFTNPNPKYQKTFPMLTVQGKVPDEKKTR